MNFTSVIWIGIAAQRVDVASRVVGDILPGGSWSTEHKWTARWGASKWSTQNFGKKSNSNLPWVTEDVIQLV